MNPNNIIVSDSSVTLIDFDISRSVKKDSPRDTFILGTAGYAAPEQFGFSQSDKRADIYALGVLANVMLTGHFPYEGIAKGAPGKAVRRALPIDPGDRFSSVRDFCRAFTGAPGRERPISRAHLSRCSGLSELNRLENGISLAFLRYLSSADRALFFMVLHRFFDGS